MYCLRFSKTEHINMCKIKCSFSPCVILKYYSKLKLII